MAKKDKIETIQVHEVQPETQESSALVKIIEEHQLPSEKALQLQEKFLPIMKSLREWEDQALSIVVENETQKDLMKKARTMRLDLRDIRVNAEKDKKVMKEDSIREGAAIQKSFNYIEHRIKTLEEHLSTQENYAEIKKQERIDALQKERVAIMQPYFEFVPANMAYGEMEESDFNKMLEGAKLQVQKKIDDEKAAKELEAQKDKIDQIEKDRMLEMSPLLAFHEDQAGLWASLRTMTEEAYQNILLSLKDAQALKEAQKKVQDRIDYAASFAGFFDPASWKLLLENNDVSKMENSEYTEFIKFLSQTKQDALQLQQTQQQQIEQQRDIINAQNLQAERLSLLLPYADYGPLVDMGTLNIYSPFAFNELLATKRTAWQQFETDRSQAVLYEAPMPVVDPMHTQLPTYYGGNSSQDLATLAIFLDNFPLYPQIIDNNPKNINTLQNVKILFGKVSKYINENIAG